MAEPNDRHNAEEPGLLPRASDGAWVASFMHRNRDDFVARHAAMFREALKRPEWVGREREYFELRHIGLAGLLDLGKGQDQALQPVLQQFAAYLLQQFLVSSHDLGETAQYIRNLVKPADTAYALSSLLFLPYHLRYIGQGIESSISRLNLAAAFISH